MIESAKTSRHQEVTLDSISTYAAARPYVRVGRAAAKAVALLPEQSCSGSGARPGLVLCANVCAVVWDYKYLHAAAGTCGV